MADRTLQQWLDYQQRVHARGIDLGLERVHEVWLRMGAPRIARTVITVGGTNGKGSTVAFLQAMLRAGGMRVGAYTSPHILRYNERVKIDGEEATDEALIAAFERIETARGVDREDAIPLTYFEFGTLAAFDIFSRANLDVALLEVGLGGRLDAVNIIDADAAIVTTVDLDHMEYLGNDRGSIGREKAGIFRAGKTAIVGESDPPRSLIDAAHRIGADLRVLGRDFGWMPQIDATTWRRIKGGLGDPPAGDDEARYTVSGELALAGTFQHDNAAAAIAALDALGERVEWDPRAITVHGFRDDQVLLPGRLQRIADAPQVIVDVAHNPQAARELANWLDANLIAGVNRAAFGALSDKDVAGIVRALQPRIARWYLAGLERESPRGLPVAELALRVRDAAPGASLCEYSDVQSALRAARAEAAADDRILVFGSFFVVAAALR